MRCRQPPPDAVPEERLPTLPRRRSTAALIKAVVEEFAASKGLTVQFVSQRTGERLMAEIRRRREPSHGS